MQTISGQDAPAKVSPPAESLTATAKHCTRAVDAKLALAGLSLAVAITAHVKQCQQVQIRRLRNWQQKESFAGASLVNVKQKVDNGLKSQHVVNRQGKGFMPKQPENFLEVESTANKTTMTTLKILLV